MISRNNLSGLCMWLCASPQNSLSIGPREALFPRIFPGTPSIRILTRTQGVFIAFLLFLYNLPTYPELDIMAPLLATLIPRDSRFNPATTSNEFRDQWVHPGDIFSVLLILGGDVVARALAQLADGGLTPFTFSFGIAPLYSIPTLFIC